MPVACPTLPRRRPERGSRAGRATFSDSSSFLRNRLTGLIRTTPSTVRSMVPTRDDVERARETIGDAPAAHAAAPSRTLGARLKCELFQRTGSFKVARRAEQDQLAVRRGEAERRDRDQRRQPRPGGRVRRRCRGHRRARRDVAGRLGAEDRGDARATAPRSTSRRPARRDAFERLAELQATTGRTLVHPFEDPARARRRGHGRPRDRGGRPGRRRGDRAGRRRRADRRDPDGDRRDDARGRGRAGDEHTRCMPGSSTARRRRSRRPRSRTA